MKESPTPNKISLLKKIIISYLGCLVLILIAFKLNETVTLGGLTRISRTPWTVLFSKFHLYAIGAVVMNLPFLFYFYLKFKEESQE